MLSGTSTVELRYIDRWQKWLPCARGCGLVRRGGISTSLQILLLPCPTCFFLMHVKECPRPKLFLVWFVKIFYDPFGIAFSDFMELCTRLLSSYYSMLVVEVQAKKVPIHLHENSSRRKRVFYKLCARSSLTIIEEIHMHFFT